MAEDRRERDAERMVELLSHITRVLCAVKPPKMKSIAFDLTFAQGRCLWTISKSEGCTMRELSKRLGVSASTACELADRLVRAQLVERENPPEDRRLVRLRLAPKGRRLFAKHKRERQEHVQAFLDRLTQEQRKRMLSTLEELNDVVGQVSREACAPPIESRRAT